MENRTKQPEKSGFLQGFLKNIWIKKEADVPFVLIMFCLMAFGLVMLLSASYAYSYYETDGETSYHFFFRQLMFIGIGLFAMWFLSHINYNKFKYFSNLIYIGACGLVVITVIIGKLVYGGDINRWLSIGPFDFQPSEIAKFAVVLICAVGLDKNHKKMISAKPSQNAVGRFVFDISRGRVVITEGTIYLFMYAFLVGFAAILVFAGSHLSGAILILLFGVAMLWIGEGRARWFLLGLIVVSVVLFIAIKYYEILPIADYMKERIKYWLVKDLSDIDHRWQTNHSLFALGSGGFFGSGLGNSKQKYFYVSEAHTDFIFSIVGEELGFVGCVAALALFAVLILRGIYIGMRAKDRFGALLAFGIMMQLGLQVALNVAVITDTLPNTGISLPFFSYGGSSTLMTLGEMGILLGISRQADLPKVYSLKIKKQKAKKTRTV